MFLFSEANVRKNFYRIFLKPQANIKSGLYPELAIANNDYAGKDADDASPTNLSTSEGLIRRLYENGYYQMGSCDAEPKNSSSDVDGLTNNIGNKLGASKNVSIEFTMHDLNGGDGKGDNFNASVALDGTTVNIVFFDENSGVCKRYIGVSLSVNLEDTGNNFEKLPIKAEKERAKITDIMTRYVLSTTTPATGSVGTFEITTAGEDYEVSDALTQLSVAPVGGTGFTATVAAIGVDNGIYALNVTNGGSGYKVGDVITLSLGSGTVPTSATLTVKTLA